MNRYPETASSYKGSSKKFSSLGLLSVSSILSRVEFLWHIKMLTRAPTLGMPLPEFQSCLGPCFFMNASDLISGNEQVLMGGLEANSIFTQFFFFIYQIEHE